MERRFIQSLTKFFFLNECQTASGLFFFPQPAAVKKKKKRICAGIILDQVSKFVIVGKVNSFSQVFIGTKCHRVFFSGVCRSVVLFNRFNK